MSENVKPETVRESLANYAHEAWAGWMKYLFGKSIDMSSGAVVIPGKLVKRWTRQMNTPYSGLPENEKESDRAEADKILEISGFASLTEDLARAENRRDDVLAEISRLTAEVEEWKKKAEEASSELNSVLDSKLEGYRALGDRAANAENERDDALVALRTLAEKVERAKVLLSRSLFHIDASCYGLKSEISSFLHDGTKGEGK